MIDWDKRRDTLVENAPLCKCGCGDKVAVPSIKCLKGNRLKNINYASYLSGHNYRQVENFKPTDTEFQIILGSCYGDAWIGYPHKGSKLARMMERHSPAQEKYLIWKQKQLSRFKPIITTVVNGGYGDTSIVLCTKGHRVFNEIHSLCYKNNKKIVIESSLLELNSLGWAIFYMDDGHYGREVRLSTENFTEEDNEIIAKVLCQFDAKVRTYKHSYIAFPKKGGEKFLEYVSPHILPEFSYKICPKWLK